MTGMEPTTGRFRGREMAIEDARMELTREELDEFEVTLEDGSVVRPFRGQFDGSTGGEGEILGI